MTIRSPHVLGILVTLASTAAFVLNDSLMKLAASDVPQFELLCLRGLAATLVGVALISARREWVSPNQLFNGRSMLRGLAEACAGFCFIAALIRIPIADVFAIVQTVPLLLIFGAAFFYRDRLTPKQVILAAVGFAGALLVAQPNMNGLSTGMLFALACALLVAARDLFGRSVPGEIPVTIVSVATSAIIMLMSGVFHVVFEAWKTPSSLHLFFGLAAGLFVALGQTGIFLAYRLTSTATVAPLFYSLTVWSVLSGLVIFGEKPNLFAVVGMTLIVASGLVLVRLKPEHSE